MKIQFLPSDPRAGTVAQMDSQRGQQLIDSGAAKAVSEETSESLQAKDTGEVAPPATMTVAEIKAALEAKGTDFKANASKADLLALLTAQ